MRQSQPTKGKNGFLERVRLIEERMFSDTLHPEDPKRMTSDAYSWLYRPSHHVETGLITEADVAMLSRPGKRLLSVGAHPGNLERVLRDLGVPHENILVADTDAALGNLEFESVLFDMLGDWPDIGKFDRIIFPESLCIALRDAIKTDPQEDEPFATDAREATLLSGVLRQALERLRPGGEIRANGPQSHPNVVSAARSLLIADGYPHELEYQRYFLTVKQ